MLGLRANVAAWEGVLLERRQRQPQEEDKLEDEVEREPVDNVNEALNHGEEGENDPVLQRY